MQKDIIIESHWIEIKGAIRCVKDNLSDAELEKYKENLSDLLEINFLEELCTAFDFDDDLITPLDEDYYEHHPTEPRSAELSQFQDDSRDIKTRSPERMEFEKQLDIRKPG